MNGMDIRVSATMALPEMVLSFVSRLKRPMSVPWALTIVGAMRCALIKWMDLHVNVTVDITKPQQTLRRDTNANECQSIVNRYLYIFDFNLRISLIRLRIIIFFLKMLVYYSDWQNFPNHVTVCTKARVQSTGHYDYTCYDPELVNDDVTSTVLQYPMSVQYSYAMKKYYFIPSELQPENNLVWTYIDSGRYEPEYEPKSPPSGRPDDGYFSIFSFLCFDFETYQVDECLDGSHTCHENAICTFGECGYTCTCEEPYQGDGYSGCHIPINECQLGSHQCHVDAFCFDSLESYGCICDDGYEGDGYSCAYADMCLNNPCRTDEDCINIANGYQCVEKPYACPNPMPYWLGRKENYFKYKSRNSVVIRTNVYNTNPAVDSVDGTYIGFLMFSKRQCSNQFLFGVDEGAIKFNILDQSPFYRHRLKLVDFYLIGS